MKQYTFLYGVVLVGVMLGLVFVILTIGNSLIAIHHVITLSAKFEQILSLLLILGTYLGTIVYATKRISWKAGLGAFVAGPFCVISYLLVSLYISCFQGVCL